MIMEHVNKFVNKTRMEISNAIRIVKYPYCLEIGNTKKPKVLVVGQILIWLSLLIPLRFALQCFHVMRSQD